jgi:hypothetical protein
MVMQATWTFHSCLLSIVLRKKHFTQRYRVIEVWACYLACITILLLYMLSLMHCGFYVIFICYGIVEHLLFDIFLSSWIE